MSAIGIDEYLRQAQLPTPNVIKLDVEGAEIGALQCAGEVLHSKVLILCELHPYAWKEFGTSFDDLLRIVHDNNRSIRYLDDELRIANGPAYGAWGFPDSISASMNSTAPTIPAISVITCSHDPRPDYLARVISALVAQTIDTAQWEFVLVDSASREPLASRIDLSWHPRARCVREDEPGLTRARLRGIGESTGDLLIFVDDDNVLYPDFLQQAARIFNERPDIGAWSGATRPEFDEPAPEWTRRHWGNLVLREVRRDQWSNLPMLPETMPCGAGLCVRREAAEFYAELHRTGQRPFALDRNGTSLLSGGDNDLAACACDIGLGVGVFSALRLTHLIPAARLREEYLVSLAENIALSTVVLRSFREPPGFLTTPPWKTRIADVLRLFLMSAHSRKVFLATRRGEKRARERLAALERTAVVNVNGGA